MFLTVIMHNTKIMKYIYFISLALIGYASSAQDPRLFENTWYLQKVIINGQDNFPPSNNEVPYVPLMIYESNALLETAVCNMGSGTVEFSLIDSSFWFTNGMSVTLSDCTNSQNSTFEGIYFNDFFNAGNLTVNDLFFYDIIDNGNGDYTLTLTSPSGDQAIYGNKILSNTDFKDLQFAIYPNPASTHLNITSAFGKGNTEIEIFNSLGSLLKYKNFKGEDNLSLDVSNLSSGLYFLKIKNEKDTKVVKRFIKE